MALSAAAMLDATFVVSNAHKIPQGGWFPLLVGSVALTLMLSWRRGREVALARREADAVPLQTFIDELSGPHPPLRVPGTAIYFTTRQDVVPAALSLNLKHNGVVHQNLMFLRIATERIPKVPESNRVSTKGLAPGLEQVEMRFGFAQKPDVPAALAAHSRELGPNVAQASFFLGREVPVPSLHPDVPLWQEKLYAFMHGGHEGHAEPTEQRKGQPIDVRVNHVEIFRAPGDRLQQHGAGGIWIGALPSETQRAGPYGMKLAFRP